MTNGVKNNNKEIYSDLDIGFFGHPITKRLSRKTNRDSVRQAVNRYNDGFLRETVQAKYRLRNPILPF